MTQYIYLIQTRECKNSDTNIYKIGKTKQDNLLRVNQYPKGSQLLLQQICSDCDVLESLLIKEFKNKYIQKLEYGREYFQGCYNEMIKDIHNKLITYVKDNDYMKENIEEKTNNNKNKDTIKENIKGKTNNNKNKDTIKENIEEKTNNNQNKDTIEENIEEKTNNNQNKDTIKEIIEKSTNNKIYNCRSCGRSYKFKQSRWKHETSCDGLSLKEQIKILNRKMEKIYNKNYIL